MDHDIEMINWYFTPKRFLIRRDAVLLNLGLIINSNYYFSKSFDHIFLIFKLWWQNSVELVESIWVQQMAKQSKGRRVNQRYYRHCDHVTDTNTTCSAEFCSHTDTNPICSHSSAPWAVSILNMSIKKKRRVLFCGAGGEDDDARVGGPQDKDDTETFSREEEGSQISISDGILPSLGVTARSCRRISLHRFIISPFDPRYRFHCLFPVFSSYFTSSSFYYLFLVYLQCVIVVWYNTLFSLSVSYTLEFL